MTDATNDAYLRVKKMIEAADQKPKVVIPNISLTGAEERVLATAIRNKIMQHASLPEYHADLVANHVIYIVQDFLAQKLHNAQEKQNDPMSGGSFRRSEE
jgi:hypothetical protein